MSQAADSATSAQTDTILVAAPGAGKQIVVNNVFVSSLLANTVTLSSDGLVAVSEVLNVDRGTSSGGTFTLTFDGETTTALAFDASAATIDTALELLSTITATTVTGTGTVGDPWVITVTTPKQNMDITGDGALLTGGDSTLTLTPVTAGLALGAYRWRQFVAANGGQTADASKGHLFTCGDNAALTYTSSASTSVFVSVQFSVRTSFDLSL